MKMIRQEKSTTEEEPSNCKLISGLIGLTSSGGLRKSAVPWTMDLLKCLFVVIPLSQVGAFGDQCNVTHRGNETTYNILNHTSNAKCEYSWTSDGTVLATDGERLDGVVSSSHSSLTLSECLKSVCATIDCDLKYYAPICCHTNCTTAPKPQEPFEPTSNPVLAVIWTLGVMAGTLVVIAMVIVMVIAVVISMVSAVVSAVVTTGVVFMVVCCRNREAAGSPED
ncbi:unnamed protein product [Arctogadus glacialis]